MNRLKNYIFITQEGTTLDPESNDVENCQVLGWGRGKNEKEAFENWVEENNFILLIGFDEVIAFELKYIDHWREAKHFSLIDEKKKWKEVK